MTRSGRYLVVVGLVSMLAMLAIAGCSGGASTGTGASGASGGTKVIEKGFAFVPADLTVKVGDVVTFSNQDSVPHHVVVGNADLGVQSPGHDVSWTADKNGVMPVKCLIHPTMIGQITVGAGGGPSPAPSGAASSSPAPPAGSSGY